MKSNAGSKKCGGQFPGTGRDCKKEKGWVLESSLAWFCSVIFGVLG
jgi:hypothetical protein